MIRNSAKVVSDDLSLPHCRRDFLAGAGWRWFLFVRTNVVCIGTVRRYRGDTDRDHPV